MVINDVTSSSLWANGRFAKVIATAETMKARINMKNDIERGHVEVCYSQESQISNLY